MINWQDVSAFASLVGMIVGAATVYLRLYVGRELDKHEKTMLKAVSQRFVTKRAARRRFRQIEDRLDQLEGVISNET